MSILNDITELISAAPTTTGYAASGQELPYVVTRPLTLDVAEVTLDGKTLQRDHQYSAYCAGASVEACFNLALLVMAQLQGALVGGTTLNTSMGYVGAQVEGHYESQVTIQLNQGGI